MQKKLSKFESLGNIVQKQSYMKPLATAMCSNQQLVILAKNGICRVILYIHMISQ